MVGPSVHGEKSDPYHVGEKEWREYLAPPLVSPGLLRKLQKYIHRGEYTSILQIFENGGLKKNVIKVIKFFHFGHFKNVHFSKIQEVFCKKSICDHHGHILKNRILKLTA